jgi:Protein of unknown function (DUF1553)/Protein of unknown function (DUF1549)
MCKHWLPVLIFLALVQRAPAQVLSEEKKNHWAWKAPVRSNVPAVRDSTWVKNPIDAFILAKLESARLTPAPTAGREQLLRRVTYDLIGLPPTPADIDAFAQDQAPDAWAKVIDRLLKSPHYGERWGRHWLDLARFAESNGYEFDEIRPDAWRYRDYVIDAFNQNKPYDRFIKEQIAGDELYPDEPAALIATGFNLLGPDMTDASSQAQRRQNSLDDMTDTAGLAFLGMTIGCARCHDHKFEPILQTDFFRLQAFFAPAVFRKDVPVASKEQRQALSEKLQKYQALIKPARDAIAAIEEPYRQKLREAKVNKLSDEARAAHQTPETKRTPQQKLLVSETERRLAVSAKEIAAALSAADQANVKRLQEEMKKFDKQKPPPMPVAMGLHDAGTKAPTTFLLKRGELSNPGEEVVPGWPVALSPGWKANPAAVKPIAERSTGRRAALASWLTSPDNPLPARVMVNRLWQHHFGRGIVATANDFGVRGEAPTHPELLDWLAADFVKSGWDIKHVHRLMLLSNTYQQATQISAAAKEKDPQNQLLSRMNRLRLEGEIIRDSLLAVSGRLNVKMGGPGVFPPVPANAGLTAKDWKASADPADHVRRSVYIFARRNIRFPFLESFDIPDSNQSCPKRERSTTAPQALALLNAPDVLAAAKTLAARLEKDAKTAAERIERAYRVTLGRRPSTTEMTLARDFLAQSPLSELCRALFNINEFVYLD